MASFETFVPIDRADKNYGLNPPSVSTSQTTLIRGNLCVASGRKLKPACVELALVRGTDAQSINDVRTFFGQVTPQHEGNPPAH